MSSSTAFGATDTSGRLLAADLRRMRAALQHGGRRSVRQLLAFVLTNSEFHSVACYRFGRYAARQRSRSPLIGIPLKIVHRIWNRWITHVHHCELSGDADIGPGMLLMHRTGVIIGPSRIGRNVVIHQNVTIGQRVAGGDQSVPEIGDGVWIGPGAVITGGIRVGRGATISAGTVLSRDVPERALVVGVPGRVVNADYDNSVILGIPG